MASIKVLLWKKKNKDGLFPLAIRIIKDRKPSYIYVGHYIKESDWDAPNQRVKKSYPNSTALNHLIAQKLAEATGKLIELETNQDDTTSHAIKETITAKKNSSFFVQAEIYLANIKLSGRYNRYVSEEPRVRRFKEFLNDKDITFREITVALLNKFKAWLKGVHNVSERTVMNYFILIRTIYNQAIKAHAADQKHYPFGREKIIIKNPDSLKIGLNIEEVAALEKCKLHDDSHKHARNVWLFSFYFAGMRIGDVLRLKWSDFTDGRLFYSMGKNNKAGSLKIPAKALAILLQYPKGDRKHDLVFPELEIVEDINDLYEVQRKTSYAVKQINRALSEVAKIAKIKKKLTMHIARHTFGNLSGDKIPVQMLQKLYRHSNITTTIGYQSSFINKDADDALDAVIGT
jgi:integrase/recombinase XerD